MEFINVKLSDIGEVVGGSTPSTKNPDNYDGNIAWITPKDLAGYNKVYISRGERNITEAGFKSCSTKLLPKNSVLFSSRAPIGYVAISENDLCTNQGFKSIIPNEKIDYKFLYYLLKHNKDYIASKGSGSTFKEVSGSVMKGIELSIPKKISDQRRISKVLFDIDKKIELNNEINNNLQELAKSIYYEKFKDKSNNGKLKDILNLHRKSIKNKDESLKYFPVDVLPMNYLITKEGKPNEEAQSSLVEFKKYDILVGAMRVYFHRVCLAAEDGITRTTTFVLRPKDENYLYYSLITLDKDDFIKYANDGSKGSTMPYAVWDNNCNEYDIYVPTLNEAKDFNDLVKPLFEIQIINEKNNRDLEQLRDTLLQKLMSGEIGLDNIEI